MVGSAGGSATRKHSCSRSSRFWALFLGALLFMDALFYVCLAGNRPASAPVVLLATGAPALASVAGGWQLIAAALGACLLILLGTVVYHNRNGKNRKPGLPELFECAFDQVPYGVAIGEDWGTIVYHNPALSRLLGMPPERMNQLQPRDFLRPEDAELVLKNFAALKRGETKEYNLETRADKLDGTRIWLKINCCPLSSEFGKHPLLMTTLEDITDYRETCQALTESERSKAVLLSHLPGLAYRCENDRDWTMRFVSDGCLALTGYTPEELINNNVLSFNDLIKPVYKDILHREWDRVLALNKPFRYEYEITAKNGDTKWVLENGQGILDEDGAVQALEGIIIDITEHKKRSAQIQYMHDHDLLTGLHNRICFEAEKQKLDRRRPFAPYAIIIADINGLKLINDALGYVRGDELIVTTAMLIKGCCSSRAVLARTGGDEFSILLPATGHEGAAELVRRIVESFENYNKSNSALGYDISVSFGFAVKQREEESVEAVTKAAAEYLNSRKLLTRKSSHNSILSYVMATIYARSQETEAHAKRLAGLATYVGTRMGLTQSKLDQLELFAMLHDIGKIGVDDRILNKPEKLSGEEWVAMRRHPEIGCRIATASPELEHIALLILTHHERWDGTGYPVGLNGEEIPLLSRILAVVDAYDAMTQERIYRKALPRVHAIEELSKNAGTQFDPYVTAIFIDCIQEDLLLTASVDTQMPCVEGTEI